MIIKGEPFHTNKAHLKKLYDEGRNLREFLRYEANNSCGDYYIRANDKIITSPGFSGGYYHQESQVFKRNIGTILEKTAEDVQLNIPSLKIYVEKGKLTPLSSPFKGIMRIPQCSVLDLSQGRLKNYADLADHNKSFLRALKQVSRSLCGKDITLLYTGGMDSTLLYMALNEYRSEGELQAISVRRDYPAATNGPKAAVPVAEELGIDLEIRDGIMPDDQSFARQCVKAYSKDFISSPFSPYYAPYDTSSDILISGQNMDAMQDVGMGRPPALSYSPFDLNRNMARYIVQHFSLYVPTNTHYTRRWENHDQFRKYYTSILYVVLNQINDLVTKDIGVDISYLKNGISLGTSNIYTPVMLGEPPNSTRNNSLISEFLEAELDKIKQMYYNEISIPKVNYLCYVHGAATKCSSVKRSDGSKTYLISNWGPFTGQFMRDKNLRDVISPKHRVSSTLKDEFGVAYDKMFSKCVDTKGQSRIEQKAKQNVKTPVISHYRHWLGSNYNREGCLKGDCVEALKEFHDKADQIISLNAISHRQRKYIHRLLNIEALLNNAYCGSIN